MCLAGYYSYAKADGHGGSGHSGRDSSGHHSDSSSTDTSHHSGGHDSDSSGHDGSDDSSGHHGSDSTEVHHGGHDSTGVDRDSTEIHHDGDDSTDVDHDSTDVRHGGDDSTHHSGDSTHVGDHGGRGRDSLHVDDSLSHRRGRGTPAEDLGRGDEHRNTTSQVTRGESGLHRRDSVGYHGGGESESHGTIFVGGDDGPVGSNLPATFRLFNMNGALVAEWQADLNDRTMPRTQSGRYMLRITSPAGTETIKVQLGQP